MKTLLLLCASLVLLSCHDDEIENQPAPPCTMMASRPDYETIPFKKEYTIQVPAGYTGEGLVVEELASFRIKSSKGTQFFYFYSCATDCHLYFGQRLQSPAPDTLTGIWGFPGVKLIKAVHFCVADDTEAILYYSPSPAADMMGRLYMKRGDHFEEGLNIWFDFDHLEEVISVLSTIDRE